MVCKGDINININVNKNRRTVTLSSQCYISSYDKLLDEINDKDNDDVGFTTLIHSLPPTI